MNISKLILAVLLLTPAIGEAPTKKQAIIEPFRVLELGVVIESGEVTTGQIITGCRPAQSLESFKDHKDYFVYLECDKGIELKINNIIFDTNEKQPVRVIRMFQKR